MKYSLSLKGSGVQPGFERQGTFAMRQLTPGSAELHTPGTEMAWESHGVPLPSLGWAWIPDSANIRAGFAHPFWWLMRLDDSPQVKPISEFIDESGKINAVRFHWLTTTGRSVRYGICILTLKGGFEGCSDNIPGFRSRPRLLTELLSICKVDHCCADIPASLPFNHVSPLRRHSL